CPCRYRREGTRSGARADLRLALSRRHGAGGERLRAIRMPPAYAAFPEAEHRERLARARPAVAEAAFHGALVVAPEHLYYLAGFDSWVSVNSPQALIFGTGDDAPTLVLRNVDLPLALETSWVQDIRSYHLHLQDVPALIAQVAAEKRIGRT